MPSVYLDNAATSFPKPDSVYRAADEWLRRSGVAFQRGHHSAATSTHRMVTNARHGLAELLNAGSADRIAFTANCTDSLHLLLNGLIQNGDGVLSSNLDHNSVIRPLHLLSERRDVTVHRIDFDPRSGLLDAQQYEHVLQTKSVKVVILNHASNVTGIIQPIRQQIQLAHEHGALVVLDAAQTVGHVPLDLLDLKVDFMAAAGHKGLLGPLGTGLIYVAEDFEHQLDAVRTGGSGEGSENPIHPQRMPEKLESGNMNIPGIAGLQAGTQWLQEQTISAVHAQMTSLSTRLVEGLSQIEGVRMFCREVGQTSNSVRALETTGIVSLNIDGMDCREVSTILDQSFQIQTRSGLHCAPLAHWQLGTLESGGTLRLSPGPFTTEADIDRAIQAITEIAESMSIV